MKKTVMFLFCIFVLCTGVSAQNLPQSQPQVANTCNDFLSLIPSKPDTIEFLDCHHNSTDQGAPFIATYRVAGQYAIQAEQFFKEQMGMASLVFLCCGWEPMRGQQGHYKDPETGIEYDINMYTETLVKNRDAWAEIPFFEITVRTFTEDI